jgi:Cu-processing system permease protein
MILVIAANTYREIIRDRILYGIFVFALLLFGLSMALGQLSFTDQGRVAGNFGLAAIQIGAAIVSIFVGSTLVSREIEKKTILTLLTRPLSRLQFVIGKTVGLMAVIFVCITLMAAALAIILWLSGYTVDGLFLMALHGIVLESIVLLAFTLFFGSFASPMFSVSFVIGVFLLGHWVESLRFFVENSKSASFKSLGTGILAISPNLEIFNWRDFFINQEAVVWSNFWNAHSYAAIWAAFLLFLSTLILGRRDLG